MSASLASLEDSYGDYNTAGELHDACLRDLAKRREAFSGYTSTLALTQKDKVCVLAHGDDD